MNKIYDGNYIMEQCRVAQDCKVFQTKTKGMDCRGLTSLIVRIYLKFLRLMIKTQQWGIAIRFSAIEYYQKILTFPKEEKTK